jgi:iron complex transport system permease protein
MPAPVPSAARRRAARPVAVTLIVGGSILILTVLVSVAVGAADVSLADVIRSVFAYDPSDRAQVVIHEVRLPRVLLGLVVGASFAVTGAVMQAMTRNPLADPGLLGVNAGALLFLVLGLALLGNPTFTALILLSFAGAAAGGALVVGIGSAARGGMTPVRLSLAGITVALMLTSLATGISLYVGNAEDVLYYTAGGIAGVGWRQLGLLLPWFVVGTAGALALSRQLTASLLGDEVATSLGQRTVLVKAVGSGVVVILAGAAVAVAGPIGFVGLIVPHVARGFVGNDYRWVIPASAVLGAALIAIADVGARMWAAPFETPLGVVTAFIGVPFFLYLIRREGGPTA